MSQHAPDLAGADQITPGDFDLDDWINGGSIAEQSVPIYGKPGLLAKIDDLDRRIDRIQVANDADGSLAGEGDDLEDLAAERDALRREFLASELTWFVRALDDDDYRQIKNDLAAAGVEEPGDAPEPPKTPKAKPQVTPNADAAHADALAAHKVAVDAYETRVLAYANARNYATVAAATTRVRRADGSEINAVTPKQVEKMKKALGSRQILTLMQAINLAQMAEPEIPAPFSLESSSDDQM